MSGDIIIIDDDPALRSMLGFSLENADYTVYEAKSRKEAIEFFLANSVHVALLDMGMPPSEHTPDEGVAVLDWLNVNQPAIKVVVLTGQNAEATSYLALKHGAFDFLEKPVSSEEMLQAVRRACLFYKQEQQQKNQEGVHKFQIEVELGSGVKAIRNTAEEKLVRRVLAETVFNVHETARRLGLKRENVYYLMKKYGIERQGEE